MSSRGDPHHPAQRIARSVDHLHRVVSLNGGPVPVGGTILAGRQTVPSPFQIHRMSSAEIPTTPLSGFSDPSTTCTGLALWVVVVPSPSWPKVLEPVAQTVPSPSAHRMITARGIPTTPLSGLPDPSNTGTGLVLWMVVPSPSWPELLEPTALTVPSPFKYTV